MSKVISVFCRPRDDRGGTCGRWTLGKTANGFGTRQCHGGEELLGARYAIRDALIRSRRPAALLTHLLQSAWTSCSASSLRVITRYLLATKWQTKLVNLLEHLRAPQDIFYTFFIRFDLFASAQNAEMKAHGMTNGARVIGYTVLEYGYALFQDSCCTNWASIFPTEFRTLDLQYAPQGSFIDDFRVSGTVKGSVFLCN